MKIQPLNKDKHASLRVRQFDDVSQLATTQYLPLLVTEFQHASVDLPIVFLKNAETGQFQPVAMFGLRRGTNAFVVDGRWQGLYLPVVVHQVPFRLIANDEEPGRLYVGIDMEHPLVGMTDGDALFDESGAETEFLERRKKALFDYAEQSQLTKGFLELLLKHDLLREKTLTYGPEGQEAGIRGLYVVDEQRLAELPVEQYIDLRDRGFLGVIYAHLVSLGQVRRLASTVETRAAD